MEYKAGDIIGAYRLLEPCGKGSFGQVFLAENLFSSQMVALKILAGTQKDMQKELDGLIRFRSCRHPNLLPILHIDKVDKRLYYTMPPADNLTPGEGYSADTLAHRLSSQGPLPASEVMTMAMELLAGLKELHRHKLMHRDIKPDNILWLDRRAVLADIGLVGDNSSTIVCGTPDFMPNDVLSGRRKASVADDLYALGKVIYCALTGLEAGEFPRLPRKLPDSAAKKLFQAVCRVCSGYRSIQSTEEFRNLLEAPDGNSQKRITLLLGIVLAAAMVIGLINFSELSTDPAAVSQLSPASSPSSPTAITARQVSWQHLQLPPKPAAVTCLLPRGKYPQSADARRLRDLCILSDSDKKGERTSPERGFSRITIDPLDIEQENNLLNKKFSQIMQRYTPELRQKCDKRCAEIESYETVLSYEQDQYAKEIREFDQQNYYRDVLYRLSKIFHRSLQEGGQTERFLKNLPRPEYKYLMPGRLFQDLFDYISAHEDLDNFAYLLDYYDSHCQSSE